MHKKFEINRTNVKGGYKWGRKVVTHNSKSDLPLAGCIWDLSDIATKYQGVEINVRSGAIECHLKLGTSM